MTGTSGSCARTACSTSRPVTPGMRMSVSTMSGSISSICAIASLPFWNATGSKSSPRSRISTVSRMPRSSSTAMTRGRIESVPPCCRCRQVHSEARAPVRRGIDHERTAVRLDRAMHHRESETGAALTLADDRIEQVLHFLLRDAGSAVGYGEAHGRLHVHARGQVAVERAPQLHVHGAVLRGMLQRVEHQIENRTVQQVLVTFHRDRIARLDQLDAGTVRTVRMRAHQLDRAARDLAHIERTPASQFDPAEIHEI